MSTTLPELPAMPADRYHETGDIRDVNWVLVRDVRELMHAYGLAVWKAAMEQAAQQAGDRAKQVRAANTRRGNISAAAILAVDQLEFLASVLRRLPLPELAGSPQERRE